MGKIILTTSISLDGFMAGPNISVQNPLGENGMRLHDWMFDKKTIADETIIQEQMTASGVAIVGRRTYDLGIDGGWGGVSPFPMPAIIVSNSLPRKMVEGFIFIKGLEDALKKAREIAGHKNIWVVGGANIAQQFIKACVLDEMLVSLSSILLGRGERLFENGIQLKELERIKITETPAATHISYKVKEPL